MSSSQLFPLLIQPDGIEIELSKPVMLVGRLPECDVQVEDENVSRRHAQLERAESGQVTLRDLGSRNGSWVNDHQIAAAVLLENGDRVRFGDVTFTFRSAVSRVDEAASETVALSKEALQQASDATMIWQASAPLTLVRGDRAEFGVNRSLTLGRDASNDIALPKDSNLSQHHARFDLREGRLVVTDLKSRNGTWVNGKRISTPIFLNHADQVRVGGTVFRLRVGERSLQPLPAAASKQRSGCMGLGIVVSGLVALVGVGAILVALLLVGTFVIYPAYFAPAPSAMSTWTAVPTWTPPPTNMGGGEIPGAAATQQAAAERNALRALVWVIVPVGTPDTTEDFSTGSGSLVSSEGYVLTNFHVVGDPDNGKYYNQEEWVWIGLNWQNPANKPDTFYRAEIVRADKDYDLALVHVYALEKGGDLPTDLVFPFLPIGNSDELQMGESLAVIGFPSLGGSTPTFTRGTVSGFLYDEILELERGWIKTDAEVNPGNSGGMAINSRGELIGVPTQVYFGTQVTGKISEIRPINLAKQFLDLVPR
jgi:pSer/pThr/pTyr-binding forkhead associated (FHA) protein/S1-C subfamily serine protease